MHLIRRTKANTKRGQYSWCLRFQIVISVHWNDTMLLIVKIYNFQFDCSNKIYFKTDHDIDSLPCIYQCKSNTSKAFPPVTRYSFCCGKYMQMTSSVISLAFISRMGFIWYFSLCRAIYSFGNGIFICNQSSSCQIVDSMCSMLRLQNILSSHTSTVAVVHLEMNEKYALRCEHTYLLMKMVRVNF